MLCPIQVGARGPRSIPRRSPARSLQESADPVSKESSRLPCAVYVRLPASRTHSGRPAGVRPGRYASRAAHLGGDSPRCRGSRSRASPQRQTRNALGGTHGMQAGPATPPPSARCERASPAALGIGCAAASASPAPQTRCRLHEPRVLISVPGREGKPFPVSVNSLGCGRAQDL
ncbi:hypothetical protein NDU88_005072 [Pleurodeles waltl]|uniref:Uncharacterized protein n=1 Tax=Pleurodeles waltl TaxID=8319 RepID=A0AAV7UHV9_PLEWA|nr:hypothetical protein NDU88_005072 [Pleurodeles waltl]